MVPMRIPIRLLCVLVLCCTAGMAYAETPSLFSDHVGTKGVIADNMINVTYASVSFELLDQVRDHKETSFFFKAESTGTSYLINVDTVEIRAPRSYTIFAHVGNDTESDAIFCVQGEYLAGMVLDIPNIMNYNIRYSATETKHAIGLLKNDVNPWENDTDEVMESVIGQGVLLEATEIQYIDVLMVYNAAALQAAGALNSMVSNMYLGIAQTNKTFENSEIKARLRLAHYGEINYDLPEGTSSGAVLGYLRKHEDDPSDPDDCLAPFQCDSKLNFMIDTFHDTASEHVQLHELRDWVGADLISGWFEGIGGGNCGHTFSSPTDQYDLATVVHSQGATEWYSYSHETGHNLGGKHNSYKYVGNNGYDPTASGMAVHNRIQPWYSLRWPYTPEISYYYVLWRLL